MPGQFTRPARLTATLLALASLPSGLQAQPDVSPPAIQVNARDLAFIRTIDPRFQSFQVGFSHLTGGETWRSYDKLPQQGNAGPGSFAAVREARARADLSNKRLRTLTRALGPMYLRFSGTTANSVYFHDSDTPPPATAPDGFTVVLTREGWKGAVDFAKSVDAKILTSFANSPGVRDASGAWTPRMAAPWLAYTRAIGGQIYAAELFNEPNAPEPPRITHGHSPQEFANDFAAFRQFMTKAAPSTKIAGPGNAVSGRPIPSIDRISPEDYADASPSPRFDILSYHFYPALADRCAPATSPLGVSVEQALTEEWLARPDAQFQRHEALRDRVAPNAPIWLTETGGAACGGLRWQPTFLDVFRYLDTHARLARQGVDAMFTHALISGSNGIIDEKTFEPNASYWGAVLWRRLMGTRVLDAGASQPGTHIYAHCARNKPGGITLLALNLQGSPATLQVGQKAEVYALSAPELQGRTVLLNGRPLAVGRNGQLPPMPPVLVSGGTISLAPTSIAFITLANAHNPNCPLD